jgi:hypothetical protein
VSTIEELLERKSSGSGLGNRENGRRGSAALITRHPLFAKVDTTPIIGSRSVRIVRSRAEATEFVLPREIGLLGMDWIDLADVGPSESCCEYGNEPSGTVTCLNIIE